MTVEHYLIAKLAEVMYSMGDTLQEREAIGCMMRNRVAASNSDWGKVVMCHDTLSIDPYDPNFIKCLWSAEEIFYNRMADMTDGAVAHYTTPRVNASQVGRFYFASERDCIVTCNIPMTANFPPDLD